MGDQGHRRVSWVVSHHGRSVERTHHSCHRSARAGRPRLGRPLVDRIEGSQLHNLKELRPGSSGRSEVRILFVFDPWRAAILLTGGDKSGSWSRWYVEAIAEAERLYAIYLSERSAVEGTPTQGGRS
ncbi:type II toxin-antitoxin system RelE/ParE family toxin [Promicromonospora sp. Populi]|uniref:type II toxin-antitoxin system RelE/ParE family toxin n=1 Tax=Promicromonospora sp. Populi TaxID=3239420 RepID=UPI0034E301B2